MQLCWNPILQAYYFGQKYAKKVSTKLVKVVVLYSEPNYEMQNTRVTRKALDLRLDCRHKNLGAGNIRVFLIFFIK